VVPARFQLIDDAVGMLGSKLSMGKGDRPTEWQAVCCGWSCGCCCCSRYSVVQCMECCRPCCSSSRPSAEGELQLGMLAATTDMIMLCTSHACATADSSKC
jgi:hypothetical protein